MSQKEGSLAYRIIFQYFHLVYFSQTTIAPVCSLLLKMHLVKTVCFIAAVRLSFPFVSRTSVIDLQTCMKDFAAVFSRLEKNCLFFYVKYVYMYIGYI